MGDLELVAREVVEGLRVGSHRSPLRGFSTEFAHHRQYAPGDSIRDLDWRVYGRTDRYYTKLYEAETNFDCHILIDASASMNYASGKVSKLEYAKFLAASLAFMVLKQRDSVGLSIFDSEVRAYLPPRSAMARTGMQMERMRRIARISGGACLSAARLRQLASSLDATPRRTEVQREIPIWDHWFLVLLIVVLAGLEWIVRRRFDLL